MSTSVIARITAICLLGLLVSSANGDPRTCQDSACIQPRPGFSCPPSKLWDQDLGGKRAICVDCRGEQPRPEQRTSACPSNQVGNMLEGRDFFCQANAWRPGPWQLIVTTCACVPPTEWDPVALQCRVRGDDRPDSFLVHSQGLRWSNGAEPYWNTLINRLNAAIGTSWYAEPPPTNYVRQAIDFLQVAIDADNRKGCPIEPVQFGNVTARCEVYPEDVVSTREKRGPFYLISLWIIRS